MIKQFFTGNVVRNKSTAEDFTHFEVMGHVLDMLELSPLNGGELVYLSPSEVELVSEEVVT